MWPHYLLYKNVQKLRQQLRSVLKFSAQIQCSNFVFLFEKIEYGFEYTFALLVLSLPKERDFRLIFWVNR
jgi:hypothetical protein